LNFFPQKIPEIILIEPTIHADKRGYFSETFRQDLFNQAVGHQVNFIQDNESRSSKGVLRGLHYQIQPNAQAKLVRVLQGNVLDVVVDIRKSSKTFGNYLSFELSSKNCFQLFIPRGFAHGYVVLSDFAIFAYKVDNLYSPEHERGIAFDDDNLGIDWQLPSKTIELSEKDTLNPTLANAKDLFE